MNSLMKTSVIPLVHAVLCLDCNCVTDANRECPVCSSRALMNLASVLDRRSTFSHSLKQVAACQEGICCNCLARFASITCETKRKWL
jgi:hypothetical protein